jgi:hypothetical protein
MKKNILVAVCCLLCSVSFLGASSKKGDVSVFSKFSYSADTKFTIYTDYDPYDFAQELKFSIQNKGNSVSISESGNFIDGFVENNNFNQADVNKTDIMIYIKFSKGSVYFYVYDMKNSVYCASFHCLYNHLISKRHAIAKKIVARFVSDFSSYRK